VSQEVGAGIKRALDEGVCTRQDLFITTKAPRPPLRCNMKLCNFLIAALEHLPCTRARQACAGEKPCRPSGAFLHGACLFHSRPYPFQLDYVDLFLIHFPISLACAPPPLPDHHTNACSVSFVPFEKRYPPEWTFEQGAPMPGGQVFANVPIRCAACPPP
jgi:hypothetical protein